jgi:hypothetical protein
MDEDGELQARKDELFRGTQWSNYAEWMGCRIQRA